ncbi:MAG: hypothetical protein QXU82_00530 [Candidatus Aenigmatarchaeota archaeon]
MEYDPAVAEEMLKRTGLKADKAAAKEFSQLLEEITADIASEADAIAMRAKKKCVSAAEVREAVKELLSS